MARGAPDYGAYASKEVSASISDMGEVAARLGSIDIFDKRGDVVDFDNFEEPILKWLPEPVGAGSAVILDSTNVKSGSQSVKLTTGAVVGAKSGFSKAIPVLGSLKIGLEYSFSYIAFGGALHFLIVYYNGTRYQYAEAKIDLVAGTISINDSTGAWKEIAAGIFPGAWRRTFHTLKLVADFTTGYYKRLLFDYTEYDLSTEAIETDLSPITANLTLQCKAESQFAIAYDLWIEDLIITQAEP